MGLIYTVSYPEQEKSQQQSSPQINVHDPDMQRKVIESNIAFQNTLTRLHEVELYMRGLTEIRMALNFPAIKDGDAGLGERPPLQAIFDQDIDAPRLKDRYFALLDRYMSYTKLFSAAMRTEPQEKDEQKS